MALSALREDALTSIPGGSAIRLSLPWIRSLPLSSLIELSVLIDGEDAGAVTVRLGDEAVPVAGLLGVATWWFLQDRIVLETGRALTPGAHDVAVAFRLAVPYLQAGPDGPLTLPFHASERLELDSASKIGSVSRDVA